MAAASLFSTVVGMCRVHTFFCCSRLRWLLFVCFLLMNGHKHVILVRWDHELMSCWTDADQINNVSFRDRVPEIQSVFQDWVEKSAKQGRLAFVESRFNGNSFLAEHHHANDAFMMRHSVNHFVDFKRLKRMKRRLI